VSDRPCRLARVASGALAALIALTAPAALAAQPTCVAGSLADYVALGSGGCTFAGVQFSDFALTAWRGPATEVTLTPVATRTGIPFADVLAGVGFDVTFTPPLVALATPMNVSDGEIGPDFDFLATTFGTSRVRGLAIPSVAFAFDPTPSPGFPWTYAAVFLTPSDLRGWVDQAGHCVNTWCLGAPEFAAIFGEWIDLPSQLDVGARVYLRAELEGFMPAPNDFQRAELSAFRALVVVQTTPEPATLALTAGGLLALAGIARRRRRAV
jgi:hypothetical protein